MSAERAATMRRAFRFRRVRFETLDVVIEGKPDEVGGVMATLNAHRVADRKRTVWTPDPEPGAYFMQAEVEETTREGAASDLERELQRRSDNKAYVLLELDRQQERGRVLWLGVKLRKTKKADVSIAVNLITELMKAAGIREIIDTDED
jgi:hypothetical protein